MRPKIVAKMLLLAVGLLTIILLASKAFRPQPAAPPGNQANVSPIPAPKTPSNNLVEVHVISSPPVVSAPPVADTNAAAEHAESVHQRIEELNALAMNNDTESRDTILSELRTNSDRTIRAAALEAAIQFGDRSVVPPLQEIAAQTEDPEEKQKILEAIDYINLPSLTEYLAAHPAPAKPAAPEPSPTDAQAPNPQSPEPQPTGAQPTAPGQ